MEIQVEIIKIAQLHSSSIDYDRLIFKIQYPQTVDIENSRSLFILLNNLIAGGAKKILIDARDLEYIDSAGIGNIISIAKLIRNHGGDIILASPSIDIMTVFKVINLQNFIKIFNTQGEAINHYHTLK